MRIFILGFMGTGKSHWGMQWAEANNMQFFDMDALIEKEESASVVDILKDQGKIIFRIKEAAMLRTLLNNDNSIISCGGGSPCFNDNMQCMNENGITIYLSASPQYILKNVLDEKEKRPLIKNVNEAELLFFVEQKLKERAPFYNQATVTLDAETPLGSKQPDRNYIRAQQIILLASWRLRGKLTAKTKGTKKNNIMHKGFLKIAAIIGALSVVFGAFGAHTLKGMVSDHAVATFETAARYHFYHAFALMLTGILYLSFPFKTIVWAGRFFILGIILFSGSLYAISITQAMVKPGYGWIGAVTPLGGLFFIAGWLMLFVSFFKKELIPCLPV